MAKRVTKCYVCGHQTSQTIVGVTAFDATVHINYVFACRLCRDVKGIHLLALQLVNGVWNLICTPFRVIF